MGARPLRQYYDGVTISVDDDLSLVDPWVRHRRRLVASLDELTDDQWKATTRCTSWDARGVVSHLVTVDRFWMSSLRAAQARDTPTTFIRGFDPSTGTDVFVDPMLELPTEVIFQQFADGTESFVTMVEAFAGDDWDATGEAPFGHVPARILMAHAFWDSWLHERDILEPLGLAPEPVPDDVLAATWYTFVVAALQGGLLDDDAPVGPGPEAPIDVTLQFDDLAGPPLRVEIDTGVRISHPENGAGVPAGSALDLVESLAGRASPARLDALPADLAAQMTRAAQIL
jgi:uncharacterized protein (TIGR03083 family)